MSVPLCLCPYVCALMSAPLCRATFCLRSYVGFRSAKKDEDGNVGKPRNHTKIFKTISIFWRYPHLLTMLLL